MCALLLRTAFRAEHARFIQQFILLLYRRCFLLQPLLPEGYTIPPFPPSRPLSARFSRRGRELVHVSAVAGCGCNSFKRTHVACSYHASNSFAFQMLDFAAMYVTFTRAPLSRMPYAFPSSNDFPISQMKPESSHYNAFTLPSGTFSCSFLSASTISECSLPPPRLATHTRHQPAVHWHFNVLFSPL